MPESGKMLSHYRLIEKIGEGGMGVVWKALDTKLDRDVAIKLLPGDLASDRERLRRFEREAKAAAALNHPNIVTLYSVEEADGAHFITMELIEGRTLARVIPREGLPVERFLDLALPLTEAIAAAHERGVTHRDLKPGNIIVSNEGLLKVLDFGLAKLRERPGAERPAEGATETLTRSGVLLGTMPYMSPEQLQGRQVDHRSDVFALGIVLYEMATGRRPFAGDNPGDLVSSILRDEPLSVTEINRAMPADLARMVRHCLRKDPDRRYQAAKDLRNELEELRAETRAAVGAAVDRPSVAVLPFANLSTDPEQEYFCDGMAEELINALAHVNGLRVVARTSAFAFKGKHEDVRRIGESLGVGAVVEGSVRKAGDRLRITAQLIDTRDGSHLWSERFDRRLQDVFAIQDEISLAIVQKLEVKLMGRELEAVVKRPTENLDAYSAYLQAWFHWNKHTPQGYQRSRECLEEAIRIDPDCARAYAGLAIWYVSQCWWAELTPQDAMAAAMPLAQRALELDDTIPEIHVFLGGVRSYFGRDTVGGEVNFRRAVELAPNSAEAHAQYGLHLLIRRKFDEALSEVRLAMKLDPLSPTWSTWSCTWLAFAGRLNEGTTDLERVVSLHPQHWMPHYSLGCLYALDSRLEEAKAESERAAHLSGGVSATVAQLACFCYLLGDTERGNTLFDMLQTRAHASYVPPTFIAWVHLARGEADEAVERVQEAASGNDPWLVFHRLMSPAYGLGDPRIATLLEGLGL